MSNRSDPITKPRPTMGQHWGMIRSESIVRGCLSGG
jgi:hypothetical protein